MPRWNERRSKGSRSRRRTESRVSRRCRTAGCEGLIEISATPDELVRGKRGTCNICKARYILYHGKTVPLKPKK